MSGAAETISITICGDGGCGKSSITLRLVRSQWTHEYDPTIEDSYSVTRNVDGVPYFLQLTDTAGQEEYRGLWATSNLKSDAFLLVYDITNKASLEALDYFMDMIDMEADTRVDEGSVPPVRIIAGNKCDLKHERIVSSREGLEYARAHGCGFMETSAREMVNIEETFALLVRRVVEARMLHSHPNAPPTSSHLNHRTGQSFSTTPALTASEKHELGTREGKAEGGKGKKKGFWRSLKCW